MVLSPLSVKTTIYINYGESLYKLKTNEGDPILYQNYKEYRKQLKVIIKCAKKDDIFMKFQRAEENSKETF